MGFQQSNVTGYNNRGNLARLTPQELASLATPNPRYIWFTSIRDQGELTKERTWNAALDLETTVPISSELTGRLKVGGAYQYRDRSYDFTRAFEVGGLDDRQPVITYILGKYPSWVSDFYPLRIGPYAFTDQSFDPNSFLDGDYPFPLFTENRSHAGIHGYVCVVPSPDIL